MRLLPRLHLVWVLVLSRVLGCGSDVNDPSKEAAGATSGGGAEPTTGAGGDGGVSASSSGGGSSSSSAASGAGTDCNNVPQYIDNLYEAAARCTPSDPGLHCMDVVDGYCCP